MSRIPFGLVNISKAIDKATNEMLLEDDLATNLDIVDGLRGGEASAKEVMQLLVKRMTNKNPNIALRSLNLLEMIVKNCGSPVHKEIATPDFMIVMRNIIRDGTLLVKNKALDLIQTWSYAFSKEPAYRIVPDTYNVLKAEGYQFSAFNPMSEAMFVALKAPDWAEGPECFRCRNRFTMTNRQHHCRNCGQVFCQACSSKSCPIPKFGFEKDVRVCDTCFSALKENRAGGSKVMSPPAVGASAMGAASMGAPRPEAALSPEEEVRRAIEANPTLASAKPQLTAEQKAREDRLREEEELQMALAISLSEQETSKPSASYSQSYSQSYSTSSQQYSTPASQSYSQRPAPKAQPLYEEIGSIPEDEDDPIARYLSSSQQAAPEPVAPPLEDDRRSDTGSYYGSMTSSQPAAPSPAYSQTAQPAARSDEPDVDLAKNFEGLLASLEQRVKRSAERGAYIGNDSSIQSLFNSVSVMHAQLLERMDTVEREKQSYVNMQMKYQQTLDARQKFDELNLEHQRKLEQQRQEQELLSRMQLEQKMKLLQQQEEEKQAYQRQLLERQRQQMLEAQARAELARQAELEQFKLQQQQQQQQPQQFQQPGFMPGQAPAMYGVGPQAVPMHSVQSPPMHSVQSPPQQPQSFFMPPQQLQQQPYGYPTAQPMASTSTPPNFPQSYTPPPQQQQHQPQQQHVRQPQPSQAAFPLQQQQQQQPPQPFQVPGQPAPGPMYSQTPPGQSMQQPIPQQPHQQFPPAQMHPQQQQFGGHPAQPMPSTAFQPPQLGFGQQQMHMPPAQQQQQFAPSNVSQPMTSNLPPAVQAQPAVPETQLISFD